MVAIAVAATAVAVSVQEAVDAPAQDGNGAPRTPAVVRDGVWYLRSTNTTGAADVSFSYGDPADIPVVGRWDHHGERKPGVVRDGVWYLRMTNSTGAADITFGYGDPWDVPLVGDWDGDGVDTPGVFRGGQWYLRNSNTAGTADTTFRYGNAWDFPLVGDWDGDGVDTAAVVRDAVWFVRNSNRTGIAEESFPYGNPGDRPIAGDWDGDGAAGPGVVRGAEWLLRNDTGAGVADLSFVFGNPNDAVPGERPALPIRRGESGPAVGRVQAQLARLGFWVGPIDGVYGDLTEQAIYAIDKYVGLPADGTVDYPTARALGHTSPAQAESTEGDVVEVDKTRQLIFVVRAGRTVAAFNTSTGDEEPYTYGGRRYDATTPVGRFEVFRQVDGWRTSHLGRLYRPKYFTTTGIALHGSTFVPPYATSHGCVRLSIPAMGHVWSADLAPRGIAVWVYGALG
jgi:hypothetical protein